MEIQSAALAGFKQRFEPFPDELKKEKDGFGTFVEWTQYIVRGYRDFPQGFSTRVVSITQIGGVWLGDVYNKKTKQYEEQKIDDRQVVVVMEVTDRATGITHQATGAAPVSKRKEVWGGAMAEAESQALRRAFAKHGMGLEMYFDDDEFYAIKEELSCYEDPEDPEEYEDDGPEATGNPMRDDQVRSLRGLAIVASEHDKDSWMDQARNRIREAEDQEEEADRCIEKIRDAMIAKGFLPEGTNDVDEEGVAIIDADVDPFD